MRVALTQDSALDAEARTAVRAARLGALLRRCGDELDVPARHGIAVRLTNDEVLADLNSRFAATPDPTDVLAFTGEGAHVGDIAISVERALIQARGRGGDAAEELRLLAVHGLLHCLGHDHATVAAARTMTLVTRRLLPDQAIAALEAH